MCGLFVDMAVLGLRHTECTYYFGGRRTRRSVPTTLVDGTAERTYYFGGRRTRRSVPTTFNKGTSSLLRREWIFAQIRG